MGKMIGGLVTGAIVGAAVGVMVLPQLDRKTQRNVRRVGKRALGVAEEAYDCVRDYMK